ncbi:MAG: hypothetical protein EOM20_02925 [Spartobacteria bacterium]|nr:hypothetical protein [Spartobacteria bacterium]
MSRLKRIFFVGLMVTAFTTMAYARIDVRRFPYQKELQVPDVTVGEVGSFLLDNDMYASTDGSYANVRLIDENGAEVPFYLRKKVHTVTQIVESAISSRILDFERDDDNIAGILVQKGEGEKAPEALLLKTGNRNFEKFVSVYGGHSPGQWVEIVRDVEIYDYSRFINVRNTRIEIPRQDFEFFRIDIANFTEQKSADDFEVTTDKREGQIFSEVERRRMRDESIHIEDIELKAKKIVARPDEPFRTACEIGALTMAPDEKRQATIWTFQSDRQPLVSFSFDTPSRNFSRRFRIEGAPGGPKPEWRNLADTTLHKFEIGNLRDDNLTAALNGERRFAQYRVTVFNQDNASLAIDSVIATGLVYEVVFLPDPLARYTVLYGGEEIRAPMYDVSAVVKSVPTIQTTRYALGEQERNPKFKSGRHLGGQWTKMLFVSAMIVMVFLLVWFIVKGAGKIEGLQ